jgi:hypothetical protein
MDTKEACAKLGDGWRLPTLEELNVLYENKDKIDGFANSYYHSSKEDGTFGSWVWCSFNGKQYSYGKGEWYYFFAVRTI